MERLETIIALMNKHRKELQQECSTIGDAVSVAQFLVLSFGLDANHNVLDKRIKEFMLDMARSSFKEAQRIGFKLVREQ